MDVSKIIIRKMKNGEEKSIVKIGKKSFSFFEGLFISKPKQSMVAEYDGKIVGSMIYKDLNTNSKKVIYIDEAFVDPNYQGLGIGKKLYEETFKYLWKQGYDVITAFVRDENVGSWKLLVDNGFKKVNLYEVQKQIGILGILKHYIRTPFPFAVGMDFYMINKERNIQEKRDSVLSFLLVNILLNLLLWVTTFYTSTEKMLVYLSAYILILLLFIGLRYLGSSFNKNKWKFRLNNGGSFITILLSFFGNVFPMNANWYPNEYEKTSEFRKKLAIPEIVKWIGFSLLPLLIFKQSLFLNLVGKIASYYLIFMIIPFYPFESFGGGRIYNYNKKIWFMTCLLSIIELVIIFKTL